MATATSELIEHWRSIGPIEWAESVYGWTLADGNSIVLTDWQRAALLEWWKRRESISTLAFSAVKKSGKTTLSAIVTAFRWLALPGLHLCAANDLDQAAGRQFEMIGEMCKRNSYLRDNTRITARRIEFIPTGSVIEALPADYAGASGANFITSSSTECWAVLYEAGRYTFRYSGRASV